MDYRKIIDKGVPEHIAIILDGNGRWAKQRHMPRTYGHKMGLKNLEKVAKICDEIGVRCLTVFAFSTENWNRPKEEVEFLMQTPVNFFSKNLDKLTSGRICINFIGRKDRFSKETLEAINSIEEMTKNNKGMKLNVAFDYGSKYEIINVTKQIAAEVLGNKYNVSDIDEELFEGYLFTKNDPKLDLLIRTSGEMRISNFLLWQLSYAELYFTDCYWPDFNKKELFNAILSFQKRSRRFGSISEEE